MYRVSLDLSGRALDEGLLADDDLYDPLVGRLRAVVFVDDRIDLLLRFVILPFFDDILVRIDMRGKTVRRPLDDDVADDRVQGEFPFEFLRGDILTVREDNQVLPAAGYV